MVGVVVDVVVAKPVPVELLAVEFAVQLQINNTSYY